MLGSVLLVLMITGIGAAAAREVNDQFWGSDHGNRRVQVIEVEVAENGTLFRFDPDLVFEDDGLPARGSAFVTQGYIYPKGTLSGANGVNPDGSPEFPDKVIGAWLCYGTHIGDGAHTTTGAWVVSTQVFSFGDDLDGQSVVTDGFELADVGVPVTRAISGGTGDYANARGESQEVFLGFNPSHGVSLSFKLEITTR